MTEDRKEWPADRSPYDAEKPPYFVRVRLEAGTGAGSFVAHVSIPPFSPLPEMLQWGARYFTRTPSGDDEIPVYREGLFYVVPQVPMRRG